MRKQQIALIALALWLTSISSILILIQNIDYEIFFILTLLGLLVIMQILEPSFVRPSYLKYIRYLMAVAIVIFGFIIFKKVIEILAN